MIDKPGPVVVSKFISALTRELDKSPVYVTFKDQPVVGFILSVDASIIVIYGEEYDYSAVLPLYMVKSNKSLGFELLQVETDRDVNGELSKIMNFINELYHKLNRIVNPLGIRHRPEDFVTKPIPYYRDFVVTEKDMEVASTLLNTPESELTGPEPSMPFSPSLREVLLSKLKQYK